ncbi:MAG: glycosyltransferase family 61 protein [Roseovarius sp.]|uniref:glycosyltransferase family 61 protein n=1 Tax=Roseovarius sp. TaxID=1486281 RepID=UPI0026122A3D|nr:glycosyltransferase family 61 protein [Roseovarius sp.]
MRADTCPLPDARIERVADAILIPPTAGDELSCGALGPDGRPLPMARTLLSGARFTTDPAPPTAAPAHLPGRWLFAGVGRHHFGHFLLEATPRLWALDHLADPVAGIVLLPLPGRDIAAILRRRLGPLMAQLGQNLPIRLIEHPTRVDELVLPSQGFGHLHWGHGTPEARAYMRRHLCAGPPPDGPGRIYISRRRLKDPDKQVPRERLLERWTAKAGYAVVHPERLTIPEQISVYRAAKVILGPDGSAFHLAAFVMPPGARVGLIQRRTRRDVFDAIARQITGFSDVNLTTFDALSDFAPTAEDGPRPPQMLGLRVDLQAAGFI